MKPLSYRVLGLAVALLAVITVARPAPALPVVETEQADPERREITIDLRILGPDGEPLGDVAYLASTMYAHAFGVTGPDGRAVVELDPRVEDDSRVLVELYDGNREEGASEIRRLRLRRRYLELCDLYAFRHHYPLAINDETDRYGMTIRASDSSLLSGTFVERGVPSELFMVQGLAKPVGVPFVSHSDHRFGFSIRIEKGAPTQLVVISPHGQARVIEITGAQAANDLDLGEIPVESLEADSTLAVRYTHPGRKLVDPERLTIVNGQITMIEASGAYFLTFRTDPGLAFAVDSGWYTEKKPPPSVPAGTYYLLAGNLWQTEFDALRRALLDGRHAALDAAGVVSVTVSPSEPGDVELDALANTIAIMKVAGNLVE